MRSKLHQLLMFTVAVSGADFLCAQEAPPSFGQLPPAQGAGDVPGERIGRRGYGRGAGGGGGGGGGGWGAFGGGGRRGGGGAGRRAMMASPAARSASNAPLELHGMMGKGDKAQVSLTDPATGESQWVRVRDAKAKWFVEGVDFRSRSAIVRLEGGAPMKLEMILTTGEPMSITPRVAPLPAGEFGMVGNLMPGSVEFDARDTAMQFLALQSTGSEASGEQRRAFYEQMRAMSPEQRNRVFSQLGQLRQSQASGETASSVNPAGAAPQMSVPVPQPGQPEAPAPQPAPPAPLPQVPR